MNYSCCWTLPPHSLISAVSTTLVFSTAFKFSMLRLEHALSSLDTGTSPFSVQRTKLGQTENGPIDLFGCSPLQIVLSSLTFCPWCSHPFAISDHFPTLLPKISQPSRCPEMLCFLCNMLAAHLRALCWTTAGLEFLHTPLPSTCTKL